MSAMAAVRLAGVLPRRLLATDSCRNQAIARIDLVVNATAIYFLGYREPCRRRAVRLPLLPKKQARPNR